MVKEHIAELGENIQIRRFQRFVLGEGIEKQETNLAEEVAAQTQAMSAAAKTAKAPPEVAETAPPEVSAPEPAAETTPDEPAPEPVTVSEQTVEPVAEPAAKNPEPVAEPTAESKGFGAAAKKSGGKSRTAKKKNNDPRRSHGLGERRGQFRLWLRRLEAGEICGYICPTDPPLGSHHRQP